MLRKLIVFILLIFGIHSIISAQVPGAPNLKVNSGNPTFPFPQFLEYKEGKTLAKYNAEGVTHCDMEQAILDAYVVMMNRARYSGETIGGTKYIWFNHSTVPANAGTFVSEGDGYAMLAAAYMADKSTFDGLWMWVHDNRASDVISYETCSPLRPGYLYGPGTIGWKNDKTTGDLGGDNDAATDGDVDIALGLLMASQQWPGGGVTDNCGNFHTYKDAAIDMMKTLTDTIIFDANTGGDIYNDPSGMNGYYSGDIGFDGYVKNGNTWGEVTSWANPGYTFNGTKMYSRMFIRGSDLLYTDYIAPGYFKQFHEFLSAEDPVAYAWNIHQFERAEASSDWMMGQMYAKGYISSSGNVTVNNDGSATTFGPHPSGAAGEDFRVGWRTALNYLWHGNPTTSWNPITHQVQAGGNSYEMNQANQHAAFMKNPGPVNGAPICGPLGASPDPISSAVNMSGISQIVQHHTVTGTPSNNFWTNFLLGASSPSVAANGDIALIADLYRQCELKWDDADPGTTNDIIRESTPKYFHGWFRLLGMLTLTGNLHAALDMKALANLKVYMSVDKTFAFIDDEVTYTLDYRNYGSLDATGSKIVVNVDPQYTIIDAGSGIKSGNTITYNIGTVKGFNSTDGIPATIGTVYYKVKVASPKITDRVCQTAEINCTNGFGWVSNEYPNNCSYTMERNCVDILGNRSLLVNKYGNRKEINPGMEAEFTVQFENSSDGGWLNGGRNYVNFTYGFAASGPNSYFHIFRTFTNAQEAYIDLSNYRVSYFMFDNVNKGIYDAATNPTGWSLIAKNLQTGDFADFDFKGEDIPFGQDASGKWDQRLIIKFPPDITAPTHTVLSHLGNRFQLHKGALKPIWYSVQMEANPASPLFTGRVQDDWSYIDDTYKVGGPGANGDAGSLIGPSYADYNNPGIVLDRFDRDACSNLNPKIFSNLLVEEFDGYTWRRVAGEGPMPGREMYKVVIRDTLPPELKFDRWIRQTAQGVSATLITSGGLEIIEWKMDKMLVGVNDSIRYVVVAQGSCPGTPDKNLVNKAWIQSDTDSPTSSEAGIKLTCITIIDEPGVTTMWKVSDKPSYDVGDNILYTIDFEQNLGTKSNPATSDASRWKNLSGNAPGFGTEISFGTGDNIYAYEKYTHGTNGTLTVHVDHDGQQKFNILLRHPGTGGKDAGIRLEFELSYWGNQVNMKLYELGTLKDQVVQEGYAAPFTDAVIKIELQDNAIRMFINKLDGIPFYTFSGLTFTSPGYAGFGKDDWSSHKILSWDAEFDSAFELEISDLLPPEVSFVSASNSGTDAGGRIAWPKIAGPVLKGAKIQYTLTGKLDACPTSGKIVNNTYANPYGYKVDSIGAQSIADCGSVVTCPNAPTVTAIVTYCKDATAVPLTATGTALKWYTLAVGGTSSTTAPTPSTGTAGTTSYWVSQTDNGCESDRAKIDVVINETAKPVVISPVTYCKGATAIPLTATGTTLKWYTVATNGTAQPSITPSTTSAGTTPYYVSQTLNGCESDRATINVVVNETLPPSATTPAEYCKDEITVQLTATGTALKWYDGATLLAVAPTPNTSAVGSKVYDVTQTENGCESAKFSITVNVSQPSTPTVTTPVEYCLNDVASALTPASSSTIVWYNAQTAGTLYATTPTPITTSAGNTSYWVAEKAGTCESPRAEVVVTVYETPKPTATTPITYCINSIPTVLSATGTALKWYTVATGGTALASAPTPVTSAAGSTSYWVTQTLNNCESERFEVVVTVIQTPNPTVTTPINYCKNEIPSALSAIGTGTSTFKWYTVAAAGTPLAGAPTPTTSTIGSTNYYVSQLENGCESNRELIEVIVSEPSTPTVTSPEIYCQNDITNPLSATANGTGSLVWYTVSSGGVSDPAIPTPSSASVGNTSYWVAEKVGSCESPRAEIVVTIKPTPVITFSSIANLCVDAADITLAATALPIGGTGTYSGTGVSGSTFSPATAGVGVHTVTYDYDLNGCTDSKFIDITVEDKPVLDFTLPLTACKNDATITFNESPVGGTFTASPSVNISAGFNPSLATPNQAYTITYNYSNGICTNSIAKGITVYAPSAPIGTNNSEVYTLVVDQASVPTISAVGTNVEWYSDITLITNVGSGATFQAPAATVVNGGTNQGIPGIYTYYAVSTEGGCVSTPTPVTLEITNCLLTAPSPVKSTVNICVGDPSIDKTLEVASTGNNIVWFSGATELQDDPALTFIPSQTAAGIYQFEVAQRNACTSPKATITLVIAELPFVNFNPPATVCHGTTSFDLTQYQSQAAGIIYCVEQTANCTDFDPATVGIYNFDYSYTEPTTMCSNSMSTTIEVLPLPNVSVSPIPDMCTYDAQIDLMTYALPTGGVFGGPASVISKQYFNPALVTPGTSPTINYLYSNGTCVGYTSFQINVFGPPSVTFSSITPACIDDIDFDLLQFVTPKTGTFSGTGVSGTDFSPVTAGSGMHTVTYDVTENGCDNSASKDALVNNLPLVSITVDPIICHNEVSVTPLVSPTGGSIIFNSTTVSDIDPSTYTPGNFTATYEYTDPITNCFNSIDAPVEIRQVATPIVSDNTEILASATGVLTVPSLGGTITWEAPLGNVIATGTTYNHTPISVGSWTYFVTENDGTCTSDPASFNEVIIDCPTPKPTITTLNYTICDGDVIPTFSASGTGTIDWKDSTGTVVYTGTDFTPTFTPGQTGLYKWSVTLTDGCTGIPENISLKINTLPSVTVTTDAIICHNQTAYTPAVLNPSGGTLTFDGNVVTSIDPALYTPGTYNLKYAVTDANNCYSEMSAPVEIRKVASPIVSDNNEILASATGVLTVPSLGGTITWEAPLGSVIATGTTYNHTPISVGSWTYFVTENDGTCTSDASSFQEIIIDCPTPKPTITTLNYTICDGDVIPTFSASGTGTIDWKDSTGTVVYTGTNFTPTLISGQTGLYKWTVTLTDGCTGLPENISLKINTLPSVSLTTDPIICHNQTAYTPTVLNPTGGTLTFDGNVVTSIDPTLYTPGTYDLKYAVTDANACYSEIIKAVEIRKISSPTVTNKTSLIVPPVDLDITAISNNTPSGTITWKDASNFIVTTGATMTHSGAIEVNSWNYCATESDGTCTSNKACMTFTIINCPTPAPTVGPLDDITICQGEPLPTPTFTITGNTGPTTWYDSVGTATNSSNLTAIFLPTDIGTYTWTVTQFDNGCEGAPATATVHILPIPNVSITSDNIICNNQGNYTPIGTPNGGTFSFNSTNISVIDPSIYTPSTYNLVYSYKNATTNCTNTATTPIEIRKITTPTVSNKTILINSSDNTLISSTTGGTIEWYNILNQLVGTGTTFTHPIPTSTLGDWEYCATETDGTCTSEKGCAIFSVIDCPAPAPSVSESLITACINEPLPTLTATGTLTKRWYAKSDLNNYIYEGESFQPAISDVGLYEYYVAQFDGTCVGPKIPVSIQMSKTLPPTVQGDISVCEDKNVTLTTTSNVGIIHWYTADPTTSSEVATGLTYTTAGLTDGDYSIYTILESGCSSEPTKTDIHIKAIPSAPTVSGNSVCAGSDVTFEATGTDINWYEIGDNVSAYSGNNYTINNAQAKLYSFEASQTIDGCESPKSPLDIQVYAIPTSPFANNVAICEYDAIAMLSAIGEVNAEFNWYGDNTLNTNIEANSSVYTPSTKTTQTVYVTQTVNNCESLAKEVEFKVNPKPTGVTFRTTRTVCINDAVTLIVNEASSIKWYSDITSSTIIQNGRFFNPNTNISGTQTYYATQTINGCESDKNSISLTIVDGPTSPIIIKGDTICEGENPGLLIAQTNNPNESIYWTNSIGDFISNGLTLQIPDSEPTTPGIYTFYARTIITECSGYEQSAAQYEIKANPVAPKLKDSIFCYRGEPFTLEVKKGINVLWYKDDQTLLSSCANMNTCTPNISGPGNYTYYISQTINDCESNIQKINIVSSKIPTPTLIGDTKVCELSTSIYSIQNINKEDTFVWSITGDNSMFELSQEDTKGFNRSVDWSVPGIDTIYAKVTNIYNCSASDSIIVNVAPTPKISFTAVSSGEEGVIKVTNTSAPQIIKDGDYEIEIPVNYTWDYGLSYSELDALNNKKTFEVRYRYGNYSIQMFAEDEYGCKNKYSQDVFVDISYKLYIPDAFSPNNPAAGVRIFKPVGYNLETFEMWVFDQWGNIVWYTQGVNQNGNPIGEWDGKFNGKSLPTGAYVWKIEATFADGSSWTGEESTGSKDVKFGNVYIIK